VCFVHKNPNFRPFWSYNKYLPRMFVNPQTFVRNPCWITWWWHQILDWKYKCSGFTHVQWKICIYNTLTCTRIAKTFVFRGNQGQGSWWQFQISDQKWKSCGFAHAQWKRCIITLIIWTVQSLWTRLWAETTFHRTYSSHNSNNTSICVAHNISMEAESEVQ